MPSRFPGMDPFIEGQMWEDFHSSFVTGLREAITERVRPRYVVRIEKRVYLEREPGDESTYIRPDAAILEADRDTHCDVVPQSGVADARATFLLTLPVPEEVRESYLTVFERTNLRLVTIIELLSPGNKRTGSDGRDEYLDKRREILRTKTSLVELDFLRGGSRLPTREPLPLGDYYAFVSRGSRRPKVEVHCWSLRQAMPAIQIPLADGDVDVAIDLQAVFRTAYDRAGYDYSIDYRQPVQPPLPPADEEWAAAVVETTAP